MTISEKTLIEADNSYELFSEPKSKKELGINDNKSIRIKKIKGIHIEHFRTLNNKKFELGDYITVVSGKNGTMKSTIMGLIAHPFEPRQKHVDPFNNDLKTLFSNVFKLSEKYDQKDKHYLYYMKLELECGNILKEPVYFYYNKSDNRFRLVPSGRNKGDGNFPLSTSYLNFKRLYPIVATNSKPANTVEYNSNEKNFINDFYSKLLQRDSFKEAEAVQDKRIKSTVGPTNSYYDYESISSGEDNLGHIVNKLIGFMRNKNEDDSLSNGILCIDEFEASLHPVVQVRLFDYLLNWARKHNVQILLTTHSLYLISHVLKKQDLLNNDDIYLNMISTAYVDNNNYNIIKNPTYEFAYKELTLNNYNSIPEEDIHKIDIICEDDIAKDFIEKIVKSRDIKKFINFITNLSGNSKQNGNSYTVLSSLCINGPKLLENSIVVFDADVPDTVLNKIKHFKHFLRLPDPESLPIEKRIVKYIIELPGNDNFFKMFNDEKDVFLTNFTDFDIKINEDNYLSCSIKPYKNWAESDLALFKKIITYYIRNNEEYVDEFRTKFIGLLNTKLKGLSLPIINET